MNIKPIYQIMTFMQKSDQSSVFAPKPNYEVLPQSHKYYEIVFYDNGCSGITTIDGIEYEFNSGDIAFIPKNTIHSEKHFSKGTLYFFCFDISNTDDYSLPKSGIYSNVRDIRAIIYSMFNEQVNHEFKFIDMLSLKTAEILLLLERTCNARTSSTKNLKYIKNYIQENYMQNINIESLAKSTGYSTAHFRALFAEAYGLPPKAYLIDLRCKNAVNLLLETTMTCTDIAYICGFSNSGQMSVLLKKKYDKNPLEIRKNGL